MLEVKPVPAPVVPSAAKAEVSFKYFPHSLRFLRYESFATVGEIRVWWRADFQSGSRVLKKVF